MYYISYKNEVLTQKTFTSLIEEHYRYAAKELFTYLANNNTQKLEKKIKQLQFKKVVLKKNEIYTTVYKHEDDFSGVKILQNKKQQHFLVMHYLDDTLTLTDTREEHYLHEIAILDYLIVADIVILILLFVFVVKLLYPLKQIAYNLQKFGDGDYTIQLDQKSSDEIGLLAKQFNKMAQKIKNLIDARERLLRNVAHELRTPITKSKLALEMLKETPYKKILTQANYDMDRLTNELLSLEKIQQQQDLLHRDDFTVETLITEALSQLLLQDETSIQLRIDENFSMQGDLFYLSMALKNLIDNALKFAQTLPIEIIIKKKQIIVKNLGKSLKHPLAYYCENFTQGEYARTTKGFGIGLSLVKTILDKHHLSLHYSYTDGKNIFTIS